MKKNLLLLICFLPLATAASAQENTLYAVGDNMLRGFELYTACMTDEKACSQEDVQALKIGAQNSLRDLVMLARSGNAARGPLTATEAQMLAERTRAVRGRLVAIAALNGSCNLAISCVLTAIDLFHIGFGAAQFIFYSLAVLHPLLAPLAFIIIFIAYYFSSAVLFLLALLLFPACLL